MPKSFFNPLPKANDSETTSTPQSALKVFLTHDVLLLALFLVYAYILSFFVNYIWLCVTLAVILFFSLQLYSLFKLNQWITQYPNQEPPKLDGVWGVLVDNVYHTQQQQKQLHQHLTLLFEKAQDSLKHLNHGIVLLNKQDEIEWGNLAAVELLAIHPQHINHNITQVIADSQLIEYTQNPDYFPDGIKILCPEYQNRYIHIKITDFGANNRLLIANDVTRMHNLEQMRKDFVDNVSHELRTPLTVLSGYLETFKEQEDLAPAYERAFTKMQAQTKRMNALVNDLLLLSNLENQKNVIPHQLIDMPNLINHIFDDTQAYNIDYGHSLQLEIDSHYDIFGAEAEIVSAFNNLISNAIKYTPKGGTITLGWHDHEHGAYFSVQDTGIGINAEHLPRLTERFYRVDTARSRLTGGTGLGLAIVKHVLIQHDARLEIESVEGQGSIFKVIFPKHCLHSRHSDKHEKFIDME